MTRRKKIIESNKSNFDLEKPTSVLVQNQGNTVAYFDSIKIESGSNITIVANHSDATEIINYNIDITFDNNTATDKDNVSNKLLIYTTFKSC